MNTIEIRQNQNGDFYFIHKSSSGEILSTSSFFNTEKKLKTAIKNFKIATKENNSDLKPSDIASSFINGYRKDFENLAKR